MRLLHMVLAEEKSRNTSIKNPGASESPRVHACSSRQFSAQAEATQLSVNKVVAFGVLAVSGERVAFTDATQGNNGHIQAPASARIMTVQKTQGLGW
jgi:hypothetical protein